MCAVHHAVWTWQATVTVGFMAYLVAFMVHLVEARARSERLIFHPWRNLMIDNCGTFTPERRLMQRAYKTASQRYHREVFSVSPWAWSRARRRDFVAEARQYHLERNRV